MGLTDYLKLVLILLPYVVYGIHGSAILFKSDTLMITSPLTKSMSMRCSLDDNVPSPSGNIIGRDLDHVITPQKKDVTQGNKDSVQSIISIVVTRQNGEKVASITGNQAAILHADFSNLNASGNLSGSNGNLGYLELNWHNPSQNQSGTYQCEIRATGAQGEPLVFSDVVGIDAMTPSTLELANYINAMNVQLENQKLQLHECCTASKELVNKVTELESKVLELEKQRDVAKSEMNAMSEAINKSRHIEHGRIVCNGSSSTWSDTHPSWGNHDYLYDSESRLFKKPYDSTPIVFLSIVYWSKPNIPNTNYFYYYVPLEKVDRFGFTMRCETHVGTQISGSYVDWISFAT